MKKWSLPVCVMVYTLQSSSNRGLTYRDPHSCGSLKQARIQFVPVPVHLPISSFVAYPTAPNHSTIKFSRSQNWQRTCTAYCNNTLTVQYIQCPRCPTPPRPPIILEESKSKREADGALGRTSQWVLFLQQSKRRNEWKRKESWWERDGIVYN